MFSDRKASYKAPPASVRERAVSQDLRRKKALEEQKRRRAERFDSTRQLDLFADLNLGSSDDEDEKVDEPVREGIAQYASLLSNASSADAVSFSPPTPPHPPAETEFECMDGLPTLFGKKKSKGKRKPRTQTRHKGASQSKKLSKWADKCMYAELLEMTDDLEMCDMGTGYGDGIPNDLETDWVAVTPVPVGKRCLAITHAASGIAGVVPNTTLRSRVLGKALMPPFPSSLPPHTILDCILDASWRDNGLLHILDVLKWKGQDIADCETPFRFWWRDTRIAELPTLPPPNAIPTQGSRLAPSSNYQFQYPVTIITIPYHSNLSLPTIANELIPLTRSVRHIPISIPLQDSSSSMALDGIQPDPSVQLHGETAVVQSDGMLLYVVHASYEPGTSPLSTWIPIRAYSQERASPDSQVTPTPGSPTNGPLDMFEHLIKRRLTAQPSETAMDLL